MLKRVSISVDNYFMLFIIITHSFGWIVFVRRFFSNRKTVSYSTVCYKKNRFL